MRWLTIILVSLIVLLQYPLWLGKGGWLKVWDYNRLLAAQREENRRLEARNAGLDAEVRDLKQGYEAIEERARFDLGMVKDGEVFVQLPDAPPGQVAPAQIGAPKARAANGGPAKDGPAKDVPAKGAPPNAAPTDGDPAKSTLAAPASLPARSGR